MTVERGTAGRGIDTVRWPSLNESTPRRYEAKYRRVKHGMHTPDHSNNIFASPTVVGVCGRGELRRPQGTPTLDLPLKIAQKTTTRTGTHSSLLCRLNDPSLW